MSLRHHALKRRSRLRRLIGRAAHRPIVLTVHGRPRRVILGLDALERLTAAEPPNSACAPPDEIDDLRAYRVLCRIDAYADYIAIIHAADAQDAAALAAEDHGQYHWAHDGTVEFDDRLYITLDENGDEIESTQVGDF